MQYSCSHAEQSFNINELEFYDKVSFLKAGIVHATHQEVKLTPARSQLQNSVVGWMVCCETVLTQAAHWHIKWCRRKLEPADLSRTGKPV